MQRIEWTPSLSVGVDLIDEQHKALITRIRDLSEAVQEFQGVDQVTTTLSFLIDYTDYHFGTEEKHMLGHNYPGLAHHMEKHEESRTTLTNLEGDFQDEGSSQALAESIHAFLFEWLVTHIQGIDQGFGTFLAQQGITLPME
ncbi:hemerythrin family protein [Candidatus Fermentibacteria bacterium]|nr:hemerythrin family protein [Candidatus Fermentibacteria bacterium]